MVAQRKNCAFGANTTIELNNVATSDKIGTLVRWNKPARWRQCPLLSDEVVMFLSSIVVLTPSGQVLGCATITFSERIIIRVWLLTLFAIWNITENCGYCKRKFTSGDYTLLHDIPTTCDWRCGYKNTSVNSAVASLSAVIHDVTEQATACGYDRKYKCTCWFSRRCFETKRNKQTILQ